MNPATYSETDAILADERFDMLGGQLAFRDFQVFLDINEVRGVVVCLFRSSGHRTQTLPASSPSNRYTRIAIDARLSEPMSNDLPLEMRALPSQCFLPVSAGRRDSGKLHTHMAVQHVATLTHCCHAPAPSGRPTPSQNKAPPARPRIYAVFCSFVPPHLRVSRILSYSEFCDRWMVWNFSVRGF
ncbi:hypothetical protein PCANC_23870 [Puccinia coronata f. sp. avenae]|uniref:Tet-like 2OG-Fe(II) oxygenase domain-containing protein n=1 Tax=Puccinia coronata f. sp. avenae TaxID=200324 RepID=A0A2N5S237_9BASI|nr:hypothetical protein PCANC_23870 [Puccinia coronata f. sp. avenae]